MSILRSLAGVARRAAPLVGGPAGIGMGLAGAAVGALSRRRPRRRRGPSDEENLSRYREEGRSALATTMRGLESDMMPEFRRELQGISERNRSRGISNGEIATSYEGDAASAFQRNIANALARSSMEVENTALERLYGDQDRRTANRNARTTSRNNLLTSLASFGGQAIGRRWGGK